MSFHDETAAWLANPGQALEKLAELALARRTVRQLAKKADFFQDASQLVGQGLSSARPYADKALAAVTPHARSLADTVQKNPALALTLGGGLAGATLGGVGNLTGRRRRGLLSDVITGGLAGTAVGGGLAAINHAYSLPRQEGSSPVATLPKVWPEKPKPPAPDPSAKLDPLTAKTKLDELAATTPGSVVHDTVNWAAGLPKRNPLTAMLLGAEATGSARGLINRSGSSPMVSSHVDDLNRVLNMKDTPSSLTSWFGGPDKATEALNALRNMSSQERQNALLRAIGGEHVTLDQVPLAADQAKGLKTTLDSVTKGVNESSKNMSELAKQVGRGQDVNTKALQLREQMANLIKPGKGLLASIKDLQSRGFGPDDPTLVRLTKQLEQNRSQLKSLQKQFESTVGRPNPLDAVDDVLQRNQQALPTMQDVLNKAKVEMDRLETPVQTRISPEQMGHITAHGSPLTAHAPDGLLRRILGFGAKDRLGRMGYALQNGEPVALPGLLNWLRRRGTNLPRFARGMPFRAGLMSLPALGMEGYRMYNEGAKQKADLQKLIEQVQNQQQL